MSTINGFTNKMCWGKIKTFLFGKKKKIEIVETSESEKKETKSRLEILFGIIGMVSAAVALMIPTLLKYAEPIDLVNLPAITFNLIISLMILLTTALLLLYLAMTVFSFMLELYSYKYRPKKVEYLKRRSEFFDMVLAAPVEVILKPVLFAFLLAIVLVLLIILPLAFKIVVLVVSISYWVWVRRLSYKGIDNLSFYIMAIVLLLLTLYLIFSAILSYVNGVEVKFDKEFYFQDDSVHFKVVTKGIGQVNINTVTYSGGVILESSTKEPFYAVINNTLLRNNSYGRFITVAYEYPEVMILFKKQIIRKFYVPYFEDTSNAVKVDTYYINRECYVNSTVVNKWC